MEKDHAHRRQVYMIKNRRVCLYQEFLEADCEITKLKMFKKEKTKLKILVGNYKIYRRTKKGFYK